MQRIVPMIAYEDTAAAIEWLTKAFGFSEREGQRHTAEDGTVTHAELERDGAIVMLATPNAEYQGPRHHRESCEATRLRGEQTDTVMTLRMVCLDQKLQEMSALVDVLAHADEAMVEKAASAAAGLGSLDQCADVPGLLANAPAPSDPALRTRVAEIRKELSRAAALRLTGRSNEAAALAEKAAVEARAVRHPPLLARRPHRHAAGPRVGRSHGR